MKACCLHAIGDLRYEDLEIPKIEKGWALVKVKAAGICSSDIPRVFVNGTYHFPTIPGHEFSGIVEETADAENSYWIGKHVTVFPLIPCGRCEMCKKHRYEMCAHYDYIGSRRDGAFAEYVAAPVWNLLELSEEIPFEVGAMFEPLSVALHAAKRASINEKDRIAVVGTGMIGFAAAQWAKLLGAEEATVIGRSEDKRKIAESLNGILYKTENDTGGKEYDVVFDAVGTAGSVQRAIELTAAGGRTVLVGNPSGDISLKRDVYWRILRKQLSVFGTWNSSYESGKACDWEAVKQALLQGEIDALPLITHRFGQKQLSDGLRLMREHREPYCKIMTLWNRDM